MRRIGLAVILALSWTCVSGDAEGQPAQEPKVAKLGFLFWGTLSSPAIAIEPFQADSAREGMDRGPEPHAGLSIRGRILREPASAGA